MTMIERNTCLGLVALLIAAGGLSVLLARHTLGADPAASDRSVDQSADQSAGDKSAGLAARQTARSPAGRIIVSVPGVPGPYCAYGVEKRLMELPGVARVSTDWRQEIIRADLAPGVTVTREQVLAIMKTADYPYDYSVDIK